MTVHFEVLFCCHSISALLSVNIQLIYRFERKALLVASHVHMVKKTKKTTRTLHMNVVLNVEICVMCFAKACFSFAIFVKTSIKTRMDLQKGGDCFGCAIIGFGVFDQNKKTVLVCFFCGCANALRSTRLAGLVCVVSRTGV